ncbi:MAG: hypothetical protein WBA97_04455 [Actinophytocola sp.]|uniref:hypothetical protein n=1 Tax=Actinophytocola sp. TaxID=1872138 RepID=UPI003C70DAA7
MSAISQRLPAAEAERREHIAAPMLDAAGCNETLASVAPLSTYRPVEARRTR